MTILWLPLLLVTNYNFMISTPTFLREIPVLLAFLIFIYTVITCKNRWITGLSLMLVLDAKEHVFFMILPGYLLWVLWEEFFYSGGKKFISIACSLLIRCFSSLAPSVLFMYLMFCTGAVPLNIYDGYILNLINKGFDSEMDAYTPRASAYGWEGKVKLIYQIPGLNKK